MKSLFSLVFAVSVGCAGAPLAKSNSSSETPSSEPTSYPSFPSYTAANLNGDMMTIPARLPGTTVVMVGFQRWHQRSIDGWLSALKPMFAANPGLDYVELPVIRRMSRVGRWFLDRAMRRGIPSRDTRARVITLYLDKQEFRRQLSIADESKIRVYLVRPTGEILWQTAGPISPAALRDLEQHVERERVANAAAVTASTGMTGVSRARAQ